nr:hypothetical protein BaRGS_009254 [Batillaria attramentaria]
MGRNILADRLQEEITHYITTLRSYRGAPVDVELITNASITNNICNIIFGKRYDYDDQRFVRCLKAAEENFMAFGPSKTLFFMPWLEYLPGDVCRFKTLLSTQATIEDLLMKQQLLDHLHNHTNGDASDVIHAYISEIRKREKSGQSTTINTDHLPQIFLGLFFGGSETTATAIRWALVFFLHNPDVQDKCYDEIQRVVGTERAPSMRDKPELTYLEATILEVLRRANIVPLGLVRSTACDVMFRGHFIPKDTFVMYILESVLLDPGVWTEPLQFRPERFIGPDGKLTRPDEFIPFAVGPRMCIGQPLARMELFLYLATMIQHFRFLPPDDGRLPSLEGNLGVTYTPKPFRIRMVINSENGRGSYVKIIILQKS